jgi:hypothetical protein
MLELIVTESVKSRDSSTPEITTIDSLLVRTSSPRRSEIRGSEPARLQRASRRFVPSAPAAKITPPAVSRCGDRRRMPPERTWRTS